MYKLIKKLQTDNPELNKFLVQRRLRSKFLRNYINSTFRKDYKKLTLYEAFSWNNTPEKGTFWYEIFIKWIDR